MEKERGTQVDSREDVRSSTKGERSEKETAIRD